MRKIFAAAFATPLIILAGLSGITAMALQPSTETAPVQPQAIDVSSWDFAAAGDHNPSGNTSTTSDSGKNAASVIASLNDGTLDNYIGIGDFQYTKGTCSALTAYDKLWGPAKEKTFWTTGPNHDVEPGVNDDVDRYMNGECVSTTKSATNTTEGRFVDALEWYSFDKGNWHVLVAPTAVWRYDSARAQAMTAEMDADLAAATAAGKHLAVVYHDPYFTSNTSNHTRATQVKPWIDMFWKNRVKVLLSGSQHNYERSCPVNNNDQCVPDGMQQFQVSTGGIGLRAFTSDPAYIEKKFSDTWGHLRMSLKADGGYTWEFRPTSGAMQSDSGTRAGTGWVLGHAPIAPLPMATIAPTTPAPAPTAMPTPTASVPAPVDTTSMSAADKFGWGTPIAAGSDEFNYVGVPDSTKWNNYDTSGHHGNGRRMKAQSTVNGSVLTQIGLPNGDTGYLSSKYRPGTMYGKWETRMKTNARDSEYHPVLLLWPDAGGNSTTEDEVDYAEGTNDTSKMKFFLHYGDAGSTTQTSAEKVIDTTQWHNYAVEWSPEGVKGYIDGVLWFTDTNPDHNPNQPMHQSIQLDWFPDGSTLNQSEMQVDWSRTYK